MGSAALLEGSYIIIFAAHAEDTAMGPLLPDLRKFNCKFID